jgi:superfamily II helicase
MIPIFAIIKVFPYSTLVFETLALLSFGISWLIKGRALGDKGKVGRKIYREAN